MHVQESLLLFFFETPAPNKTEIIIREMISTDENEILEYSKTEESDLTIKALGIV
jgi:hypothetical protein